MHRLLCVSFPIHPLIISNQIPSTHSVDIAFHFGAHARRSLFCVLCALSKLAMSFFVGMNGSGAGEFMYICCKRAPFEIYLDNACCWVYTGEVYDPENDAS